MRNERLSQTPAAHVAFAGLEAATATAELIASTCTTNIAETAILAVTAVSLSVDSLYRVVRAIKAGESIEPPVRP